MKRKYEWWVLIELYISTTFLGKYGFS